MTVKANKKHIMFTISSECIDKLDKIAKEKYRGTNRSQAVRWLIEDMFDLYFREGVENKKLLNDGRWLMSDGRVVE